MNQVSSSRKKEENIVNRKWTTKMSSLMINFSKCSSLIILVSCVMEFFFNLSFWHCLFFIVYYFCFRISSKFQSIECFFVCFFFYFQSCVWTIRWLHQQHRIFFVILCSMLTNMATFVHSRYNNSFPNLNYAFSIEIGTKQNTKHDLSHVARMVLYSFFYISKYLRTLSQRETLI